MELIKNIASVIGCAISAITLLGIIVKPIRQRFINWIEKKLNTDQNATDITSIKDVVALLVAKVDTNIEHSGEANRIMIDKFDELNGKVDVLGKRVFENERDRIQAELSNCAARCRRNIPLSGEEYMVIKEHYRKYESLGLNGPGHDLWTFINAYYNNQNFNDT